MHDCEKCSMALKTLWQQEILFALNPQHQEMNWKYSQEKSFPWKDTDQVLEEQKTPRNQLGNYCTAISAGGVCKKTFKTSFVWCLFSSSNALETWLACIDSLGLTGHPHASFQPQPNDTLKKKKNQTCSTSRFWTDSPISYFSSQRTLSWNSDFQMLRFWYMKGKNFLKSFNT